MGSSGEMTTGVPLVELHGVRVDFQRRAVPVLDIDRLDIRKGERVALIGSSGAGKTTLLMLAAARLSTWVGRARVLGRDLTPGRSPARAWRRRVGFIFQDFALIERASVQMNVRNGRLGHAHPLLSLLGRFSVEDDEATRRAIAEMELVEQAWQRADTLSGGQQQRVAVARCLAQEPELVLADEPVSNLDPALATAALELLVRGTADHGSTLVMTLHQPEHARRYADRVIGLRAGQVVFDGAPQRLTDAALAQIYARTAALAAA
jgi:phosphonate transport system ATP-binding protein